MQIDFALQAERRDGLSPLEAITQGCLIRFRPIMMTTMAALLGALPIAVGIGTSADCRPLGLTVVGAGLLVSPAHHPLPHPRLYPRHGRLPAPGDEAARKDDRCNCGGRIRRLNNSNHWKPAGRYIEPLEALKAVAGLKNTSWPAAHPRCAS